MTPTTRGQMGKNEMMEVKDGNAQPSAALMETTRPVHHGNMMETQKPGPSRKHDGSTEVRSITER